MTLISSQVWDESVVLTAVLSYFWVIHTEESPQEWSLISIRFFPFCLLYDKDFLLNLWGSTVELTPVLIRKKRLAGCLYIKCTLACGRWFFYLLYSISSHWGLLVIQGWELWPGELVLCVSLSRLCWFNETGSNIQVCFRDTKTGRLNLHIYETKLFELKHTHTHTEIMSSCVFL